MSSKRQFARNVSVNWVSMLVGMVVPFFLSPFVVHRLGDMVYGVWVLIVSTVGYMSLMDLGMRTAVMRFVAQAVARKDEAEARRVMMAALGMRAALGAVIMAGGLALAWVFPHLYRVPADLTRAAQWAVLVTALNLALGMVLSVYAALLSALHRFDVASSWTIVQLLLRAGGIVWILLAGHGILALAVWELVAATVGRLGTLGYAFWRHPGLCRFARVGMATLKTIWGYSGWVFLNQVACQLVYATDNLVVGAVVSAIAVTYYSIGGNLIAYALQIVSSMTTTFMPIASGYDAAGNVQQLRRLLLRGTEASLALILPIAGAFFFRGHTFIRLWMGAKYAQVSGTVLQILVANLVVTVATVTAGQVAYGMGRHKMQAVWGAAAGVANLALSIGLARHWAVRGMAWGDYAVAWGTTIPALALGLGFWPPYLRRILGVPIREFLWRGWGRILVVASPYAVACWWTDRVWPAPNMAMFFLQIAAILPIFVVPAAALFRTELLGLLRGRLAARAAA